MYDSRGEWCTVVEEVRVGNGPDINYAMLRLDRIRNKM